MGESTGSTSFAFGENQICSIAIENWELMGCYYSKLSEGDFAISGEALLSEGGAIETPWWTGTTRAVLDLFAPANSHNSLRNH